MVDPDADDQPDEGAWIFVSHSHRDLHEVRRVRDALEAKGHQPLLFFLKCLGDDAELDGLIRREIAARKFFLLCDSPNARTSRYVQQEVELIKDLPEKVRVELSLDSDWQAQLDAIDDISRRATVFFSYSRQSLESVRLAPVLADALVDLDYRVFLDVEVGSKWVDQMRDALDMAIANGFVLLLLSPEAMSSAWVTWEVRYVLERHLDLGWKSRIVPVLVSRPRETLELIRSSPIEAIRDVEAFDLSAGEIDEKVATLTHILASR
jgi:hypothetical protein